ncbi:D-stereospecific aminopeptidase [Allomuricauda ruestringensis DSM 13258]|uniref:D-stereospecific aminopeptidase n=2 Tax=Flagellimonas TaxID=444459 RepID=G2PPY9_ALLRU|nr:D-stereospecific aminopeptidase [Allomuricauda ruestringensis DSM 13258]
MNLFIVMKAVITIFFVVLALGLDVNAQINPEEQAKIDSIFSQWDHPNSPGVAIGTVKDGKLVYSKGYGMANLDYGIPISGTSKFYIASMAKQFTAACIALLAIEGKIDLDDEVHAYIPELPRYGEVITIRNLVHHTSGLRDYLELMYLSGTSFEDYFTIEDGIQLLGRQSNVNFLPGEKHSYSNSGYILLAEIVNRVSGMTIREYADRNIFKPLGMNDTFFNDDHSQIINNRVVSYRKESDTFKRYVQNFDALGDGNLITTIKDLYLWDQNFYRPKVGGAKFLDLMLTKGRLNNGDTIDYAFGLVHDTYKGLPTLSHGGAFLGFRTQFIRFPEQRFSIIVLASVSGSNPTGKAYQIADILLKDKLSASEPEVQKLTSFEVEPVPLTKDELRQFEASYWSYEENYSRKIYLKSDTLRYSRGEQNENRLLPIDRNEFQMLDVTDGLRVNFHLKYGKPYKMIVTVNGNNPSELYAYMPLEAKDQDLKALEGSYYSKELDCTYVLKVRLDGLVLMVNDVEMGHLRPVMDGLFVIEDFGVIKFDEKNKNVFVLDANRVKQIKFSKSKTIG